MPKFRNIPGNTTAGFSFEGQQITPDADGIFEAPLAFNDYAQAHGLELVPDQDPAALVPPVPAPGQGPTLLLAQTPEGGLTLGLAPSVPPGPSEGSGQAIGAIPGSQAVAGSAPAPLSTSTKPVMQWTNQELLDELHALNLTVEPWDRPSAIRLVAAARKPKE